MREFEFKDRKFKELFLHIAHKCADDPSYGATKLNKILYFSDFSAYAFYGEPITGARYFKLERGPAPMELLRAKYQLERAGALVEDTRTMASFTQKRPIPLRAPDYSVFTAAEIALVDTVIDELRSFSATDVSKLSHMESGWQLAQNREIIPYEAVFLWDWDLEPPSPEELEEAKVLATRYDESA